MRYEMLLDRLLVRVLEANTRTKSGLYIPEMAIDGTPWLKAEVVAVGPGLTSPQTGQPVPLRMAVGDVVIFFRSQASGEQLVFLDDDGAELLCIRAANCLCILRDLDRVSSLVDIEGKQMVVQ